MIAAPAAGAFFGEVIGWRGVFLAITAVFAVAVAIQVIVLPSIPPRGRRASTGMAATFRLPWLLPGLLGVMLFWAARSRSTPTSVRSWSR
jgi:predicted MFS family arabinose efflux permease